MTKKEKKELEKKLGEKIAYITKLESDIRIDTVLELSTKFISPLYPMLPSEKVKTL